MTNFFVNFMVTAGQVATGQLGLVSDRQTQDVEPASLTMPSLTKPELPSEIAAASGQLGIRSSPLFYTLDGIAVTNAKNILALSTGRPSGVLNIVSVPTAEEKRLDCAKSIFSNWKWLNEVALRHEALIQRRWSKKSPNKRRKLLLDIWSSIPPHHWSFDIELRPGSSRLRIYTGHSQRVPFSLGTRLYSSLK
ncbi:hypothetical protein F4779DRAFT_61085 [Xylariaceae sp. FL0662B]|nr:hypothetical protein F4779DRAFT_61085 [Xylariaceae sp. FL0662B]